MEDLDSLLDDLGRGKSSTLAKKQRPPSSRVDLNELENLMEDLAAPTAKKTPAPTPVAALSPSMMIEKKSPPVIAKSAPLYESPKPQPIIEPQAASSSPPVDDLDALMESLNASSSRSSRRVSTRPSPAAASPSPPGPVMEPIAPAAAPVMAPKANVVAPPPISSPPISTSSQNGDRTSASSGSSDLDSLLSNLSTQMNVIDAENPVSKGSCASCRQPILGEIIQAIGRSFHPEHFACGNCRNPLGTRNFYEQNGVPYCEKCFQEMFCPKCAHCDKPVLDQCITALGKKWHADHFICTQCLKPFGSGNFYERDGRPYCEADFYGLFAPKCAACNEAIRGDCINALGSQWHPEHFVCTYCQKAFQGNFFDHGGKPYCEAHYHQQIGSLCGACSKPITGRCVNALDKKWHPEHFVCAFCMNPLAGGAYSEQANKAYCKECHGKLFGK